MAWPEFRYRQDDLPALCRERPLVQTEYYHLSQLYGFDDLLREYAGLPTGEPVPFAMEHFVSFDAPDPCADDRACRLPLFLAVNDVSAAGLRRHVSAEVVPIGSSLNYVARLEPPPPADRRGTIVFPDKSGFVFDTDFDRDAFAHTLAALPAEFQPVYVSVFWKDFVRGTHAPYARAGLGLVSSGHQFDPLFLRRQADLCRQFKYACANEISTSFCAAVLNGCRFFYLPTGELREFRDGKHLTFTEEPSLRLPGKQECLEVSAFPPGGGRPCPRQRALAERFAGSKRVRTPDEIRALADRGRELLRAAYPPERWAPRPGVQLIELSGLRPAGFDADGWAVCPGCGLEVPGGAGAELTFLIPGRPDPKWSACWMLSVGEERRPLVTPPGFWKLTVPARADGRPCRVRLSAGDDIPLGDGRDRAVQLLAVRRTGAAEKVQWVPLPGPPAQAA